MAICHDSHQTDTTRCDVTSSNMLLSKITHSILKFVAVEYRDRCNDKTISKDSSLKLFAASPSRLSCRLFNACSLCNILLDFTDLLVHESLDVIAITKTWLNDSVSNSLVLGSSSSAYSIFHRHLIRSVVLSAANTALALLASRGHVCKDQLVDGSQHSRLSALTPI